MGRVSIGMMHAVRASKPESPARRRAEAERANRHHYGTEPEAAEQTRQPRKLSE